MHSHFVFRIVIISKAVGGLLPRNFLEGCSKKQFLNSKNQSGMFIGAEVAKLLLFEDLK